MQKYLIKYKMYENDRGNTFAIAVNTKQEATDFVNWQKQNTINMTVLNEKYGKIHGHGDIPFSVTLIS